MMMMMMKKKGSKSLAVVALLLASVNCIMLPSKEDLARKFHRTSIRKQKFLCDFYCYFILFQLYKVFLQTQATF